MEQFYYNPLTGFVGPQKLQYRLKQQGVDIPFDEIKEFHREQAENEVLRQIRSKKKEIYRKVVADHIGSNIHMDLIDVSAYQKWNGGMRYILTAIDVYSRKGFLRLISNKHPDQILSAFLTITPIITPEYLCLDGGNEFKGVFKKYCSDHNIGMHINPPGDHRANGLIERFNRTILDMLRRFCAANGSYKYDYVLQLIERNYNTSYHRTLKESPDEVFEREFRIHPQEGNEGVILPDLTGKKVRLRNKPSDLNFTRGLLREQYSRELYEVVKKDGGRYLVRPLGLYGKTGRVSLNDILISAGQYISPHVRERERRQHYSDRIVRRELGEKNIPTLRDPFRAKREDGRRNRKMKRDPDFVYGSQ